MHRWIREEIIMNNKTSRLLIGLTAVIAIAGLTPIFCKRQIAVQNRAKYYEAGVAEAAAAFLAKNFLNKKPSPD